MAFICRVPSIVAFALLAGLALVPAGCGSGDGVKSYDAPRTSESGRRNAGMMPPGHPPVDGDYRILGALYPAGPSGEYWYFKFMGPADQLGAHEADFDKMAKSVKLQGDSATVPALDLPAGWSRTGPRVETRMNVQVRFDEVLKVGALECTISRVGGSVDSNVARWASQVGAPLADAAKATTEFTVNGVTALRVDLRGTKNPAAGMAGPMMGKK